MIYLNRNGTLRVLEPGSIIPLTKGEEVLKFNIKIVKPTRIDRLIDWFENPGMITHEMTRTENGDYIKMKVPLGLIAEAREEYEKLIKTTAGIPVIVKIPESRVRLSLNMEEMERFISDGIKELGIEKLYEAIKHRAIAFSRRSSFTPSQSCPMCMVYRTETPTEFDCHACPYQNLYSRSSDIPSCIHLKEILRTDYCERRERDYSKMLAILDAKLEEEKDFATGGIVPTEREARKISEERIGPRRRLSLNTEEMDKFLVDGWIKLGREKLERAIKHKLSLYLRYGRVGDIITEEDLSDADTCPMCLVHREGPLDCRTCPYYKLVEGMYNSRCIYPCILLKHAFPDLPSYVYQRITDYKKLLKMLLDKIKESEKKGVMERRAVCTSWAGSMFTERCVYRTEEKRKGSIYVYSEFEDRWVCIPSFDKHFILIEETD